MAIEFRKNRNDWRVYWNNPFTKRREHKSFPNELEARKFDAMVKYRLRFERESFMPDEPATEPDSELTLEKAHFLYLQEKQFGQKGLEWQVDCMKRIHAMIGQTPIAQIDRETLEKVKQMELSADIKPVSARAHLSVLRTLLRWCHEKGYLDFLPPFPRLPEARYEHFIPPTREEIERIYAVAAPHLQRAILLACSTGVRVGPSELFGIKWTDFDFQRGVLCLRAAKKNHDEPIREIPVMDSLLQLLQEWFADDTSKGIAYVIHYRGKPIKKLESSWNAALKKAGITRRIRPYDQRHMFGSEAIAAGIDIGTVAKLMGHTNPAMILKHYQHVADKQKKAAIEALSGIIPGDTVRGHGQLGK